MCTRSDGLLQSSLSLRLADVHAMLLSDVLVFLQEKDQKYVFASLVSFTFKDEQSVHPEAQTMMPLNLEPLSPGPALHSHLFAQSDCQGSGKRGARSVCCCCFTHCVTECGFYDTLKHTSAGADTAWCFVSPSGLFLITAGTDRPEMVEVLASSKEERNTWRAIIQDAMACM